MKRIQKKAIRDLLRMKIQVLTIALVLGSGIAALITFLSTHDSLLTAQRHFYHESRFADVFAELKRAPLSLEHPLSQISGVVSLETRLVQDYLLHIPNQVETAVGRFISYPESRDLRLNRLYLREGRMLDPTRTNEVLVSENFAKANGFRPGDTIAAIINGKYQNFNIVGTVLSPEYIYAIRGENVVPDDRLFGIFWTSRKGMEAAMDMKGSFNSLSLILGPGSNASEVIDKIDQYLMPFGGLGAYERKDQLSNRFISDEISQNKIMAVTIPIIFLAVAAYLLNVVLTRMIGQQRTQIATLKALGYSNRTIALHYSQMVFWIVLLGLALGSGVGAWLGKKITILYTNFYHFPVMIYTLRPALILIALAVSLFAAVLGVWGALRQIFKLQPAEAMRPPAPPIFHESLWERLGVARFFSNSGKIIFRNLTLRPFRTALGVFGLAFAVMVTMLGLFWGDTISYIILTQFSLNQREDVQLTFVDPLSENSLEELIHLPGVLEAEGYRIVPVRFRFGHRKTSSAIFGFPPHPKLRQLLNKKLEKIQLPAEGLLLTQMLADRLKVAPGDWVEVEVLEGKRQKFRLPVTGIVQQWLGFAAYSELSNLQQLLDDTQISMALLRINRHAKNEFQKALKKMPKIAAVNFKTETLEMFQKTMVQFIMVFATFLTLFALVIAVGVVYNSARVALSERTWELMSLRVLGFNKSETFRILRGELSFQILCAIPLGCLLGYAFAALLVVLMHTETFEIPFVIRPQTYAISSLVVAASALVSIWSIRRRLNQTQLVAALKVRE